MAPVLTIDRAIVGHSPAGPSIGPLNLQLSAGQGMILSGGNGAGKSTLLSSIMGLSPLRGGIIDVDRSKVAYVPQDYRASLLPWASALANIFSLARFRGQSKATVERSFAAFVGGFSLDFDLTKRVSALSGGQQQLVAILRALVCRPGLLLLDEPLANLSPSRREFLLQVLAEESGRGTAWIAVSHEEVPDHVGHHSTMESLCERERELSRAA